jgi:hypothetical protein
MIYRGYELEQKTLMVGWQISITKDDRFVWHGNVATKLEVAITEAQKFVDALLVCADTHLPSVAS